MERINIEKDIFMIINLCKYVFYNYRFSGKFCDIKVLFLIILNM